MTMEYVAQCSRLRLYRFPVSVLLITGPKAINNSASTFFPASFLARICLPISMSEKIFVIGGTGNIGERTVRDLVNNGVAVTLYTRSPEKAQQKFPQAAIVQGDYDDFTPFEKAIPGHTRLFLLIADLFNMPKIKGELAAKAYAAGVKQIVDISSLSVSLPWRTSFIGNAHRLAEEAILSIPNRGTYVALRPTAFMSNHLLFDVHSIKGSNTLRNTLEPDELEGWISTNDIGALAAIVLQEPIEKHGDGVYEMTGCALTSAQRAAIFSKILGREITYTKISVKEKYDFMTQKAGIPHLMAMDLLALFKDVNTVSPGLEVLLGRRPESFEEWLAQNKDAFM